MSKCCEIQFTVQENQTISFVINDGGSLNFNTDLSYGISEHNTYMGPYVVIPKVYDQILETDDLLMSDDVTVKEITYSVTQNEKGLTAQIGEI